MISLENHTPSEVISSIASRVKERRLEVNLTQEGLAERADIKLPTYRKFERTGKISLEGLAKVAFALDMLEDFNSLFSHRRYSSIQDVIRGDSKNSHKRGRIK